MAAFGLTSSSGLELSCDRTLGPGSNDYDTLINQTTDSNADGKKVVCLNPGLHSDSSGSTIVGSTDIGPITVQRTPGTTGVVILSTRMDVRDGASGDPPQGGTPAKYTVFEQFYLQHPDSNLNEKVNPAVNADYVKFDQMDVSNLHGICFNNNKGPPLPGGPDGFTFGIADHVTIEYSKIHHCGDIEPDCADGVNNDPSQDTLVDLNDPGCASSSDDTENVAETGGFLPHEHDHGIYIGDGTNWNVWHNWIYDNLSRGISFHPMSTSATNDSIVVTRNVITNNAQYNVHFADDVDGADVYSNTIVYEKASSLFTDERSVNLNGNGYSGQSNKFRNNCVKINPTNSGASYDNADGNSVADQTGSQETGVDNDVGTDLGFTDIGSNVVTDPSFVDWANGNYLIIPGTTCYSRGPDIPPGP